MKEILISKTEGDKTDNINNLIDFLIEAKNQGATHYRMTWSNDPMWSFKWFEIFRIQSIEESNREEIIALENKLKELKNKENGR